MKRSFLEASATLIGTTIGAGIFAIPYVIAQSGFLIGLFYILFLGLVMLTLNLYVGEIVLRTKEKHQIIGYAKLYLGEKGKKILTIIFALSIYGALTAYLIGEGQALSALFNSNNQMLFTLIFFALASTVIFFGIKALKKTELLMGSVFLVAILFFIALLIPQSSTDNLQTLNWTKFFIPYGVILFAFWGTAAIPEMREELQKNKKELRKAILIGSLIPLVIYALFSLSIVLVTGAKTTELATLGIGTLLGKNFFLFGNALAVLSMTTAFLGLGLALKEMYQYDYKLNNTLAFLLTCIIPLLLVLSNILTFSKILMITGSLLGGIEGVALVMMYRKAKKGKRIPEYSLNLPKVIDYILIAVFILGFIYTLLHLT